MHREEELAEIYRLKEKIKHKAFRIEKLPVNDKTRLLSYGKQGLRQLQLNRTRDINDSFPVITGMRIYREGRYVRPKPLLTDPKLMKEWVDIIDPFLFDIAETIWHYREENDETRASEVEEQALGPLRKLRIGLRDFIEGAQDRERKREQCSKGKRRKKKEFLAKSDPYKKLDRELLRSLESLNNTLMRYVDLFRKTIDYKYFYDLNPKGQGRIDRENDTIKKIRDLYKIRLSDQKEVPIKSLTQRTIEANMAIVLAAIDFWPEDIHEKNELKKIGSYVEKLHKRFQVIDRKAKAIQTKLIDLP